MSETPQFEAPLIDPDLTDKQNRRQDVLMNSSGFTGVRAAAEISANGTETVRQGTSQTRSSSRTRRGFGQRQNLVADTPPQAHQAAMDRVSEGAPVKLTDDQRVFGAQQARAFLKHLKNGSSEES